jgi:hypothetical protein
MLFKKLLSIALLILTSTAFAETQFLSTHTNVETYPEAKKRLGKDKITESDLTRTHYIVERDSDTKKVTIRPLRPMKSQQSAQNETL